MGAPSRPQRSLTDRTRQETEEAARRYTGLGWKAIALHGLRRDGSCTCEPRPDGKPCPPKNKGKHPRANGWTTSPPDLALVIELIHAKPPGEVNLGVQTGAASGIWVLDVDPRNGGIESLAQLIEKHGPLPHTVQQRTGSGGVHYVFEHTPGVTCSNGRLGPGLDVKGDGGQIVVWPSISAMGAYSWIVPPWEISK